jgi:hypothetical protein
MFSAFLRPFSLNSSIKKIGFDDVIFAIKNPSTYIIINTLPINEQGFLIKGTTPSFAEENKINTIIERREMTNIKFVIYGKNSTDNTVETKYWQLEQFGFTGVYVYYGGLFEWVMLQEIYGKDIFATECTEIEGGKKGDEIDILLRWKPLRILC